MQPSRAATAVREAKAVLAVRVGLPEGPTALNISDAINTLGVLFLGTGKIPCEDAADANDDGKLDIADAVIVLGFLFLGDELPPGTTPGKPQEDPTPDELGC